MPFTGSGGYNIPISFSPNTVISSSQMNANFADIANNGFANTVVKDGQQVITGQLRGLVSANPAWSFQGDLDTGFGSDAANVAYVKAGGVKTINATATGAAITGTFSASGASTFNAAVTVTAGGIIVTGNSTVTGTLTVTSDVSVGGGVGALGSMAVGTTLSVTGATTLAAVSATTGSFSSTLAVTGASTLTGALSANNAAGVTARNTIKAFGKVVGGVLQPGAFGASGVADSGNDIIVTLSPGLANANYAVSVTDGTGQTVGWSLGYHSQTTTAFNVRKVNTTTNGTIQVTDFSFMVLSNE